MRKSEQEQEQRQEKKPELGQESEQEQEQIKEQSKSKGRSKTQPRNKIQSRSKSKIPRKSQYEIKIPSMIAMFSELLLGGPFGRLIFPGMDYTFRFISTAIEAHMRYPLLWNQYSRSPKVGNPIASILKRNV